MCPCTECWEARLLSLVSSRKAPGTVRERSRAGAPLLGLQTRREAGQASWARKDPEGPLVSS